MRTPTLVLFLLSALGSFGQSIATNDDGSQLALASPWIVPGQPTLAGGSTGYIVRLESGVWTAVPTRSSASDVSHGFPFLSGDGAVIGYEQSQLCSRFCGSVDPGPYAYFLGLPSLESKPFLRGALSRNGRFLLHFQQLGNVAIVEDLLMQTTFRPNPDFAFRVTREIADDGSVLATAPGSHSVFLIPFRSTPREFRPSGGELGLVRLSANGRRIVASYGNNGVSQLVWADVETGAIYPVGPPNASLGGISKDGTSVLYCEKSQCSLWSALTLTSQSLGAPEGDGPAESALSGDGSVIFILNSAGLFRYSGSWLKLFGPLPASLNRRSTNVAGSDAEYTLAAPYSLPLHFSVPGTSLEIPRIPTDDPSTLLLQVPWELSVPDAPQGFVVSTPNHPLQLPVSFGLTTVPRVRLAGENSYLKAAQQDFRSLVSSANPARPGSTIHTWAFGLGALDQPLATGQLGPADPPARPLATLHCTLEDTRTLEMPFLAYAPNLLGVYQIDLTIPADWPTGLARIECRSEGWTSSAFLPIG